MSANRPLSDERFEAAVQELLAERGRTTNGDIRAALDGIEHLPRRTGGRRSWLAAPAAVAVLVVGGGVALGRLSLPSSGNATDRVGRAAFVDDPRLAACEAANGTAAQVFEMTHAEWFPLYFPGWYRGAPELEVPDPALVVIGPPVTLPVLGGAPRASASGPTATPHPSFSLCIAVGASAEATLYQYGPTWFDRIVPVLSDADIARAAHLDPDVLADPAAWPSPERLAPCGGVTGNEQFIFEASHLSDLAHHFPATDLGRLGDDDPAIVIVYRDPLPVPRPTTLGSPVPDAHDICVIDELAGAEPDHLLLLDIDTAGFHVRIDRELAEPSRPPEPTVIREQPQATPEPLPAWAGDATASLECAGPPSTIGPRGPQDFDRVRGDAGTTVDSYLEFARGAQIIFPTDGFSERATASGARLYRYDVVGRTKAVIVAMTDDGTEQGRWHITDVASCDPSEYDGRAAVGGGIHIWADRSGNPVRADEVLDRADCYDATQIRVGGRLYVRIPNGGVDPAQLDGSYDASTTLPKEALSLGYTDGSKVMWTAADGKALYIVDRNDTAHAERLPHVQGDEAQRTDCN